MKKIHDYSWAPEEIRHLLFHGKGGLYIRCEKCGKERKTQGPKYVMNISSNQYRFCRKHRNDKYSRFATEDINSWPIGYKRCGLCLEIKPLGGFHYNKGGLFDRASRCADCRNRLAKRHQMPYEKAALNNARYRAKKFGLPFNITLEDIVIPDICPVLGVPIVMERGSEYGPSIDRVVPEKGYVKGNIAIMSRRANVLKNNMTTNEARRLLVWMEQNVVSG